MIKNIVKDTFFLSQKSSQMTEEDKYMIDDLKETYNAHIKGCVGMAANMVGYNKNMIIVNTGKDIVVMINPKMIKHSDKSYKTMEGCLSLEGERETERYETVKISYLDEKFRIRERSFSGFAAQIVQHEMDHCNGIII